MKLLQKEIGVGSVKKARDCGVPVISVSWWQWVFFRNILILCTILGRFMEVKSSNHILGFTVCYNSCTIICFFLHGFNKIFLCIGFGFAGQVACYLFWWYGFHVCAFLHSVSYFCHFWSVEICFQGLSIFPFHDKIETSSEIFLGFICQFKIPSPGKLMMDRPASLMM